MLPIMDDYYDNINVIYLKLWEHPHEHQKQVDEIGLN